MKGSEGWCQFYLVLERDCLPEFDERQVDGMDPPSLPGVPLGHQVRRLLAVGDVLVRTLFLQQLGPGRVHQTAVLLLPPLLLLVLVKVSVPYGG